MQVKNSHMRFKTELRCGMSEVVTTDLNDKW